VLIDVKSQSKNPIQSTDLCVFPALSWGDENHRVLWSRRSKRLDSSSVVERFNDKSLNLINLLKRLDQLSSSSSSETLRRQRP
jgi:hypothetical protein